MMKSHVTSSPRRPRIGFAGFCFFAVVLLTVSMLSGCGGPEPKAPEPTVNPHPHEFTKLKISVEPGSGVNNVEVYSIWAIGNIGCAPIRHTSGSSVQKEIHTREEVNKIDPLHYVATIIEDRFDHDKCQWRIGAYDVRYMHNRMLFGLGGGGLSAYKASNPLKLVCIPPPHFPICETRSAEVFDKSHFHGVFNVIEEIEK